MNPAAGLLTGALVLLSIAATALAVDAATRREAARRVLPATRPRLPLSSAPPWVRRGLEDAGIDGAADPVWTAWVASVLAMTVAALVVGGVGLSLLALIVAVVGPLGAARACRGRGTTRIEAALPTALEAVARGLRSGASLRQAIGEAARGVDGALARELGRVAAEAERGVPTVDALDGWANRRPLPGVCLAVAALALGAETGGAQARAIDGVAATLRQRLGVAAEARALATQARASAAVIAVAPLVFCGLASAADPRLGTFLLRTPLGLAILAAGLGLDAVGALWMARLTRVDG